MTNLRQKVSLCAKKDQIISSLLILSDNETQQRNFATTCVKVHTVFMAIQVLQHLHQISVDIMQAKDIPLASAYFSNFCPSPLRVNLPSKCIYIFDKWQVEAVGSSCSIYLLRISRHGSHKQKETKACCICPTVKQMVVIVLDEVSLQFRPN